MSLVNCRTFSGQKNEKKKNEQYLLFESHIEALTFDMFSADYLTAKMFKLFKKICCFQTFWDVLYAWMKSRQSSRFSSVALEQQITQFLLVNGQKIDKIDENLNPFLI